MLRVRGVSVVCDVVGEKLKYLEGGLRSKRADVDELQQVFADVVNLQMKRFVQSEHVGHISDEVEGRVVCPCDLRGQLQVCKVLLVVLRDGTRVSLDILSDRKELLGKLRWDDELDIIEIGKGVLG